MAATTGQVISYANTKIQGNGNIGSTQGISFINDANLDFHLELINRGVDASELQETYYQTVTPVTGTNPSTFLFPADMLFLKTITVNFMDQTEQNYIQAQQIDVANTPGQASFQWFRINQPTNAPLFDNRGDWYEIFPSFQANNNLTNAIALFYYLVPTTYSTTADALSYPESTDLYILANKVLSLYYESISKFDDAAYFQKVYMDRIGRFVKFMTRGSDQPVQAKGVPLTGWSF